MRIRSIDFLRFIAVFLVMMRHFNFEAPAHAGNFFYVFQQLQLTGWVGVDLFFVISGFLISGLIFNEMDKSGNFKPARFLIRRGFKIYPSFYLLIVVTAIFFFLKKKLDLPHLGAEIFYVQNYFTGLWNHTWSLAVEEHFYFMLAFVFWWLTKKKGWLKSGIVFFILLIVLINCIKYFAANDLSASNRLTYYTHFRIDGLLFGVLVSYIHRYHQPVCTWWQRYIALPFAIVLLPCVYYIGIAGIFSPVQFHYGYTVLYLYFGNLLLLLLYWDKLFAGKLFSLPVRLGFYSYSVYLWHMPCKFWVVGTLTHLYSLSYWTKMGIAVLSSFILGVVFARIIEMPFLRLRDRLYPSASK
jgi:peptidoglycan/LPS O-acetylase OafA/YrhL